MIRIRLYATVPLGWWFLHLGEPDIHWLSKTPQSPHRRLSWCSLPVPKQFVESLRSLRSFAQSATGGTWQSAHRMILMFCPFPYQERFLRCRGLLESLGRHEVLFSAFHGQHVGHHLPGHRQGGPVGVPSAPFFLVDFSQLVAVAGRQLGGF